LAVVAARRTLFGVRDFGLSDEAGRLEPCGVSF
jgi:hypothetical protein